VGVATVFDSFTAVVASPDDEDEEELVVHDANVRSVSERSMILNIENKVSI
jgi:hypothetical protein